MLGRPTTFTATLSANRQPPGPALRRHASIGQTRPSDARSASRHERTGRGRNLRGTALTRSPRTQPRLAQRHRVGFTHRRGLGLPAAAPRKRGKDEPLWKEGIHRPLGLPATLAHAPCVRLKPPQRPCSTRQRAGDSPPLFISTALRPPAHQPRDGRYLGAMSLCASSKAAPSLHYEYIRRWCPHHGSPTHPPRRGRTTRTRGSLADDPPCSTF